MDCHSQVSDNSFQQRIRRQYSQLSQSERRVADHVLDQAESVIYESISECAERANVSEPTVIRFSRTIGFSGYQEMKIALAKEMVSPARHLAEEISLQDEVPTVLSKVLNLSTQTLHDTIELLGIHTLSSLAERLWACGNVIITGVGTSGIAADFLHYKLLRLGLPSQFNSDIHRQFLAAGLMGSSDVCLAISQSGATKETLAVARVAKQQQAWVTALTSYARSPLARIADGCLLTSGRETPFGSGSGPTLMSQLILAECIFITAALANRSQAFASIERTGSAVKQQKM